MKTIVKDAEAKLLQIITDLQENPEGYYAIHYHLSRLNEQYRSDYQIKIAVNILNDLFKNQPGALFVSDDSDIYILYQGSDRGLLEKAIFQLRYLFMDDPLAYSDDGFENEDFCSVYDLEFHWRDFFMTCKNKISKGVSTIEHHGTRKRIVTPSGKRKKLHVFDHTSLNEIMDIIEKKDISSAFRSQYICAYINGKKIKQLFKETYVSIEHFKELVDIDIDLMSNVSLFKYLTKTLDKHVLKLFNDTTNVHITPPVSINLNIKTLLSDDFVEFDSHISPKTKSSVIIEINISDVFEDIHAFVIARDAVRKLGYRICLDGLDILSFHQVDMKGLGFDLAKIKWSPDMILKANNEINKEIEKTIKKYGTNRVILCRCDEARAISYGHSIGISLFQGRYVDELVHETGDLAKSA